VAWSWRILFVLLLASCAEVPKKAPEPPKAEPEPEKPVVAAPPKMKSDTLKYLSKRRITPQVTRPLNVRSRCSHKDEIGTTTKLDLLVDEAEVKTFTAQVTMKEYGTCRFNLNEFEQVEKMPQALLKHKKDSACTVRLWEEGTKVTVAFNGCANACEGDAFSYLWPIMIEAKSGRCF
jgi:hypothetical protein